MRISKTSYLHGFTFIVLTLGLIRLTIHLRNEWMSSSDINTDTISIPKAEMQQTKKTERTKATSPKVIGETNQQNHRRFHRILSVRRYDESFPDANDIQLVSARKLGIKPIEESVGSLISYDFADNSPANSNIPHADNRLATDNRQPITNNQLVYIGASPWFHVDRLKTSIPYLVPCAAILLHDIGRAFYDSLDVKGVPLHMIITTSVLRTKEHISRLRRHNVNATENSCHIYGTTFDICYNRYKTVEDPDGLSRRTVSNDTLKWVLSEVLRDFRAAGRCYVKYEVKQGCFHITVR